MASVATVLAFHAHPYDEVLLTGGTLARLAAEGHGLVIVVACDGVMGPAAAQDGQSRLEMLRASAAALGGGPGGASGLRRKREWPGAVSRPA